MKKLLSLLLVMVVFTQFGVAPIVKAQSATEVQSIFGDSVFYDPNGCTAEGSAVAAIGGPISADLDPATTAKIQTLRPVYEKYAAIYGIPWQIFATKHYRETGLSLRNPSNGQGVWQLYSLVTGGSYFFPEAATVSIEEFDRQTGIMAEWYFKGEKLAWAKNHSLLELQKVFTYYNGWGDVAKTLAFYNAKKANVVVDQNDADALLNWNAYGMNQYDGQHTNMIAKIKDDSITVDEAAAAAQRLIDTGSSGDTRIGPNGAIGAVPFYVKLGGPISGGGGAVPAGIRNGGSATESSAFGKIYVIGDSLTVGMEASLTSLIGNKLALPIEAETGINIQNSVPKVNFPVDTDTVLVGLGTNNFGDNETTFKTNVDLMLEKIRSFNPNARIFWTNIYAPRSDIVANLDTLNNVLAEIDATDNNFKVIDWRTEAQNGGYTFPDQLHPREYDKRADFIYRSLSGGGATTQPVETGECAGATSGPGAVSGNIVQTALNFAWFETEKVEAIRATRNNGPCSMRGDPGQCGALSRAAGALIGEQDAKPAYVTAARQFNKGNDSDGANWAFSDCGVYVATVLRASGADPTFQARGTSLQMSYIEGSGKYDVIPFTDTALAQPGDVLIKDGHIRIFIGQNSSSPYNVAEASWGNHVPATLWNATIDATNPNDAAGSTYKIARLKS